MRDKAQHEQILTVAHEKFRRFGIRRVTMDEIARDLRISKKTLYQHFSTKDALVEECLRKLQDTIIPAMANTMSTDKPVRERLIDIWEALAKIGRLTSSELLTDVRSDYPHLWNDIDTRRHTVFAKYGELLAAGVASGDINPAINPQACLRIILAIVEQVMIPETFARGEFTPQEAVATLTTLFKSGLLNTARSASRRSRS